jgi:hypothetical protein
MIKEFYYKKYGKQPGADIMAHLKRELIHSSLQLVLGGAFADAKRNGHVTKSADNILRCWFPDVVLHSTDYIEK